MNGQTNLSEKEVTSLLDKKALFEKKLKDCDADRKQDSITILAQQKTIADRLTQSKNDSIAKFFMRENNQILRENLQAANKRADSSSNWNKWLGGSVLGLLVVVTLKLLL